jgi:L-ribulose-5-phosphate 4-epimerase
VLGLQAQSAAVHIRLAALPLEHPCQANLDLVAQRPVTLTWGNVSGLSDDRQLVVIKASEVPCSQMRPEHMVVVEGDLRPSSDMPSNARHYRALVGIGGINHTHSRYATMVAQARREIPCGWWSMVEKLLLTKVHLPHGIQ